MAPSPACPCGSGTSYVRCCRPLHRGEREAEDAESLMRSRFSAFAQKESQHLLRTLHPRNEEMRAGPESALAAIKDTANDHRFVKLQVLDRRPADGSGIARVLFVARVFRKGQDMSFVELSEFEHDGVGWRYLRGDAVPARSFEPGELDQLDIARFEARG
jgi:SEC-C motif-containing protein